MYWLFRQCCVFNMELWSKYMIRGMFLDPPVWTWFIWTILFVTTSQQQQLIVGLLVQILIVFSSVSLSRDYCVVSGCCVVLCCAVSGCIADHFRKSSVKVYRDWLWLCLLPSASAYRHWSRILPIHVLTHSLTHSRVPCYHHVSVVHPRLETAIETKSHLDKLHRDKLHLVRFPHLDRLHLGRLLVQW